MRPLLFAAAAVAIGQLVLIYDTQQRAREGLELLKLQRDHQQQVIRDLLRN